jgi:chemotaxis protein MotB
MFSSIRVREKEFSMPISARVLQFCVMGLLASTLAACNHVPRGVHRQSLLRSRELYQQNGQLTHAQMQSEQTLQALAAEQQTLAARNQQLERQASILKENLEVATRRLDNLTAERSQLQDRYVSLLNQAKGQPSPLSDESTRRFEDLARRYPGFEFDPNTGVSKFGENILFDTGSSEIKKSAAPILREFASIMRQGEAGRLNILVVGHTDDQQIAKNETRAKHPTNWHLSTNRANSVVLSLASNGIRESRMGAAGYSMFQPVVANSNDQTRQKNRRVEIFVLAPDAAVAGWDKDVQR